MEQPQKVVTEEKRREEEPESVSPLGRRHPELGHTPQNADVS